MNVQQKAALLDILHQHAPYDGRHTTQIPGLHCFCFSNPIKTVLSLYSPSIYFVVQGAKQVLLAGELYSYGTGDYLALSVDLPITSQVTHATSSTPFLCLQIEIDALVVNEVAMQHAMISEVSRETQRGLAVGHAEEVLVDTIVRLGRLLATPDDIAFLAPLMIKELYYHLLKTEQGAQIARVAVTGSAIQRIASVIAFLKQNVHRPVQVESLAAMANMSLSTFHHTFKTVTAMSPLRYHKQLRLLEARRLMVNEDMDAISACLRIGYESPSQFSRDYRRMFGTPPRQDKLKLLSRN